MSWWVRLLLLAVVASAVVPSSNTSAGTVVVPITCNQTTFAGACECRLADDGSAVYCDSVVKIALEEEPVNTAVVFSTSLYSNNRLARSTLTLVPGALPPRNAWLSDVFQMTVDTSVTYQELIGFGGAFTDSVGINLQLADPEIGEVILQSYFGGDYGIGYSMGRIPIASADFSTSNYTYDDAIGDYELQHFSIEMDFDSKIPVIKRAMEIYSSAHDSAPEASSHPEQIRFFSAPWSPPFWMKDNNSSVGGHLIFGDEGNKTYESYSDYLLKFIDAYEQTDIPIWALSVQNEPLFNPRWQSMLFDGDAQRIFVGSFLGPKARAAHPNLKIIVHDDQRPFLLGMAQKILSTDNASLPDASKYVDGFGVHWYTSVNDYINEFGHLADCHKAFPDKFILATEACAGYLPWEGKPLMGDWSRGELYSYDIIGDLENWASGWVDWNLVLDPQGGPNHVQNFVDSPIIVDVENRNRFWKQPMFYHMAHFSKFITPGFVRVHHDDQYSIFKPLDTTVWKDPSSGRVVVVLSNRSSFFDVTYRIAMSDKSCGYFEGIIEKKSIQTLTFREPVCG
eukprot:TRINITY_DN3752_c0_g1_i2.p1 TRINITY_DN3752_c0_g1~~TRINITY_DN3752_c0_g1_i2.p1  ORF type:complete len:566 (-),score=150.78 TRINITY_DN3752_c0_g1_i2:41-1738(-)